MRYGLIGERLEHSFSKTIHEQLADYTYDLIPLSREELGIFLKERRFAALNVTIPYKETVIPFLNEIDPHAKAIGAVNTIVNRNGRLCGYNTDFYGFRYMLEHNGISVQGKKTLVLGRGGAAKAAKAVLRELGAAEILTVYYKPATDTVSYEDCYELHSDAQIIVNATPVGMFPHTEESPIRLGRFPHLEGVADVVYNPLRTWLVLDAESRGIPCAGGLEMLVAQAKYAVEIFLGKKLPESSIETIHRNLLRERRSLVLIGMDDCGTAALGRMAAERTGKIFVNTNEKFVEKTGIPIPEYLAKYGEAAFRKAETEILREYSTQNGLLISTGGGIVKNPENIRLLKQNGSILWLKRPAELPDDSAKPYAAAADAEAEIAPSPEEGLERLLAAWERLL